MLLAQEDRQVTTSGVMETARATIKTSPKIFNFFEKQTYSNVPKTICRELVANARDSHVMAGTPDLPVEVWLPTILEPTFRVRDHGLGMAHEFMMTSFMCYADGSTKDQSNLAIGGFGIGSKSPFAYIDQYTIVSRFDGIESVYSVFKDADGIPSIGRLGFRDTAEPNGVEVSFPVKPEDFETFEKAAFEALCYFEPLPDIKNATTGSFKPPVYVARGTNWGMRPQAGDLSVVMGGVCYPVNASNLTYKFPHDSAARKLLTYGLDIALPIGSCQVALSREALAYDDTTITAIREACEGVAEEVAASFATMFDHIDSAWEARVALHDEVGEAYSTRAKFLLEHAKWKGAPFDKWFEPLRLAINKGGNDEVYKTFGFQIWTIDGVGSRKGRKGKIKPVGSARWETPSKLFPGLIDTIIIDDLPQVPKSKTIQKIKAFAGGAEMQTVVARPLGLAPEKILEALGDPSSVRVVYTSSLPEPIVERAQRSRMQNRPRVRMFKVLSEPRRDYRATGRINPNDADVWEIDYADQPATGILVVMEQFALPADVHLLNSGLLDWSEVRFVNAGDARKLKGWTDFRVEFERRKKEKIAAYPELPARLAVADHPSLRYLFDFFRRHPGTDFSSAKPLGRIFNIYQKYVRPLTHEQRLLARFVTSKLPARVDPEGLNQQFRERQWKAARLLEALPSTLEGEDMRLFQENL